MAEVAFDLSGRDIFSNISDAFKITVAAWSVTWIEPWLDSSVPEWPDPVKFFIASMIAALTLLCLIRLGGWPSVKVEWSEDGNPVNEICAKLKRRTPKVSQPFRLRISPGSGGLFGHWMLKILIRTGCRLDISVENASVTATCERYTKRDGLPTITSNNSINGVTVDLGDPPERPGGWHIATICWNDDDTPQDALYHIKYKFVHEKRFRQFLLNWLIFKSIKARKFRVQGK